MVTTVYPYGEDFPILKIETSLCTAEISLYGGHVLSWAPAGHKPVIYMSPKAVFKKGKALRGGIPLCWPWFGKNTEDASQPAHGVARISTWQVGRCEEGEDGRVNLMLALPPENDMLPSAALGMEIGNELTMSLITLDVPRAMPYSAAMHTYFAVSDYEQVAVTGLEDLTFPTRKTRSSRWGTSTASTTRCPRTPKSPSMTLPGSAASASAAQAAAPPWCGIRGQHLPPAWATWAKATSAASWPWRLR